MIAIEKKVFKFELYTPDSPEEKVHFNLYMYSKENKLNR